MALDASRHWGSKDGDGESHWDSKDGDGGATEAEDTRWLKVQEEVDDWSGRTRGHVSRRASINHLPQEHPTPATVQKTERRKSETWNGVGGGGEKLYVEL